MAETINTASGAVLSIERRKTDDAVEISITTESQKKFLLHWGIQRKASGPWQAPAESIRPQGTQAFDQSAVRTSFSDRNGRKRIIIRAENPVDFAAIIFVLFYEDENMWDNNNGKNYRIDIPVSMRPALTPAEKIHEGVDRENVSFSKEFGLENNRQLAVAVSKQAQKYRISIATDFDSPLKLHWGIAQCSRNEWFMPPPELQPQGTEQVSNSAETPFTESSGFRRLDIEVREQDAPIGISFVLHSDGKWINDRGRNFYVPVVMPSKCAAPLGSPEIEEIAEIIIDNETSKNSWTLMHRFNLCFDMLDRAGFNNIDGLALIFVWLRFSAIRQLDWQRNYNTKPRELGHSMDRLTLKLAERYSAESKEGEFIKLMLSTLGRGSNAQRVRDEVLNIMHRHHIKEVSGHFMEEWHQKLHNNTTPDDLVICEAFIEFLKSNGDLGTFYRKLEEGGVTKERLESYERPIRSHPDFIPHLKDALIYDFEQFLGILKEVHLGTDIGIAIHNARYIFDNELHGLMDFIWSHRDYRGGSAVTLAWKLTEARRRIASKLSGQPHIIRDLLFLDIALEDHLRVTIERDLHSGLSGDQIFELISIVLENIGISVKDEEIAICAKHWNRIRDMNRFTKEWSLEAKSVIDRMQLALGNFIDRYNKLLQPKAEFLGNAFHATRWSIDLFSEEVMRGRPAFVLSMLLRNFDPILRKNADLGDWQIISPSPASGKIEIVESLKSVQGNTYSTPTIIVTDGVGGYEEIPQGVAGVITSSSIDVLAHLSVRARNARVLFATCYDPKLIAEMKKLEGRFIKTEISAKGDVLYEETSEAAPSVPHIQKKREGISAPQFTAYAVSYSDFNKKNVGGKSHNLNPLRGKLPDWISFPEAAALPFGVFDKVTESKENEDVKRRCAELTGRLHKDAKEMGQILSDLRKTILDLRAPEELVSSLRKAMEKSGLQWPQNWEAAWTCIKKVWASKWNKRAYLSRKANGIPDNELFMAVLVQRVIEAEYSFVIHTVNPFTGNKDEIYGEAVLGMGEALVGNYPGKALSFTRPKKSKEPLLLSYPSKGIGLYGSGLIFRSDSNGEDLEGFAGAGLYDSFPLEPYRKVTLDYADDSIIRDAEFRKSFMNSLSEIGTLVEKVLGSAQDIEGAFSQGKYYIVQTRPQVGI